MAECLMRKAAELRAVARTAERGHGAPRNLSMAAHFSCRLFDPANPKAIDHKATVNLRK
jgi:hypothetical protein